MFGLTVIALPFLFMLAVYRLVQIPMQLRSGALQVLATTVACLALLAYTVALLVALVHLPLSADRFSAYLPLAAYVLAYPLVYLAAAWGFLLRPQTRRASPGGLPSSTR